MIIFEFYPDGNGQTGMGMGNQYGMQNQMYGMQGNNMGYGRM